jgi:putative oxidoreductase
MLLIGHGMGKWQNYNAILEKGFLDPFGIGVANSLTAAAVSETVMAGLVAVGLLTRLACIPLVVTFGVAAFIAHANDPLFMGGGPAKEPALMYGLAFLTLLFTGPGKFSIDGLMTLPRKEP